MARPLLFEVKRGSVFGWGLLITLGNNKKNKKLVMILIESGCDGIVMWDEGKDSDQYVALRR